jgi:hypothetical protein
MNYLIWSWEHMAWWAEDMDGYTPRLDQAGRYSYSEAAGIVVGHIPAGEEVAITEYEALRNPPQEFRHDRTSPFYKRR